MNIYFGKSMEDIFSNFSSNDIHYFLLRDYYNPSTFITTEDMDIVIDKKMKKKAESILIHLGWKTPKYNINYYGHKQYFKWEENRLMKLDVLYGIYFANGSVKLFDQESVFISSIDFGSAKIPLPEYGLLMHICHLLFDKKDISDKNRDFLVTLLSKVSKNQYLKLQEFSRVFLENPRNNQIRTEITKWLNQELLIKNRSKVFSNTIWCIKRILAHFVKKKQFSIAVIGVDGSGKSTSINAVKNYFGENVTTEYMGFKDFHLPLAKKWYKKNQRIPGISFIVDCIFLPIEMTIRYKNAFSKKREIVLFDRYPWEIYDNSKGLARCVNYFLFKILFTKPDGIIYLHCPIDVSLSRKNDIENVHEFMIMKEHFDSTYMFYPGALVIDTSQHDQKFVVDKTIEFVNILRKTI